MHVADVSQFSNIEAVDDLLKLANQRNIPVIEPFQGVQEFGGQLTILGPTEEYYIELVKQHLEEERTGKAAARRQSHGTKAFSLARRTLDKVLSWIPVETLTDEGETGPRNDSSAIALLQVDGQRLLFTGDAGMPALGGAADYYERIIGAFSSYPLSFFQGPHHGSKRNVGPTILNRTLGPRGEPYQELTSFISSAKTCEDHPSPKVSNALKRRGCRIALTEGNKICHRSHDAPERPDYSPVPQIDWIDESGD